MLVVSVWSAVCLCLDPRASVSDFSNACRIGKSAARGVRRQGEVGQQRRAAEAFVFVFFQRPDSRSQDGKSCSVN